jgi:hypothetical protein
MVFQYVSSLLMTRKRMIDRRDKLATQVANLGDVLRGSLFQRTVHHSSGCPKCARGDGHPLSLLSKTGKTQPPRVESRRVAWLSPGF